MKCRSCAAEIADKAIVCYRCGTPTAVEVPASRTPVRRASTWWWALMAILVAAAVAMAAWLY